MGGGISGALVANQLCRAGFKVVVVDRRHVGLGSTAASTALLQYEIDKPLHELMKLAGEKNAIKSYQLCRKAIADIEKICHQLNDHGLFLAKPSFQFATAKKDVADLRNEYLLRKKAGFAIQWLEADQIIKKFGFLLFVGLLSQDGAESDAYKLTHSLLKT